MKIYALYSECKKSYYRPILAENEQDCFNQIVDMIIVSNDQSLVMALDSLSLVELGTYDPFDANNSPLIASWDAITIERDLVSVLPFPPKIRERVDAIFGRNTGGDEIEK